MYKVMIELKVTLELVDQVEAELEVGVRTRRKVRVGVDSGVGFFVVKLKVKF